MLLGTLSMLFRAFHSHQQQLIYRELNVSTTMQQPSSVVYSKLQYNTTSKYTNKQDRKKQVFSSRFYGKLLHASTSGVRVGTCNQPVIRWGEVSTLAIQRVGLTPDVQCLQRLVGSGVATADGMFNNSRD